MKSTYMIITLQNGYTLHSSTREYSTVKYVKNKLTISTGFIIVVYVIILLTMVVSFDTKGSS